MLSKIAVLWPFFELYVQIESSKVLETLGIRGKDPRDYAGGVRLDLHSAVAGDTRGSRPTRDLTFAECRPPANQSGELSASANQERLLSAVGVSPAHPGTRNYITCTGPHPHSVLSKHSNRKHEGISRLSSNNVMCDLLCCRTRYSIFLIKVLLSYIFDSFAEWVTLNCL